MTALLERPTPTASPFDSIKRTRPDGTEYWSARDLLPLMGYDRWEHFNPVVERARIAAHNQGLVVEDLFQVDREKSGGRPREDVHLTRFAAYLVAMNGDPRKPEVAAAQAYFAIRTHEAETAPARDLSIMSSRDILALAQRLVEQEERADKAETVVRAVEASNGLTPTEFHKHYFSDVPARQFFEHLYRLKLLIDQRGSRGRDERGRLKNGHQHQHPGAAGKPYFYLHGRLDDHGVRRESVRVRPGRPEVALVEFLASKGLTPNANTTASGPKGITA